MSQNTILTVRQHPIIFLPLCLQWGIFFFLHRFLPNILILQQPLGMTNWTLARMFLTFIWLMLMVQLLKTLVDFLTTRYTISAKKLITRRGLIARYTTEILLSKIESVQVSQSLTGRLLGYGSIAVQGTGGLNDPFHHVPAPFGFRDLLYAQIQKQQQNTSQ